MKYKGELFIVSSLALWGFFPLIAKTILVDLNALLSLAFISFFAIFWFLIFFVKNKEWKYFEKSAGWKYMFASIVCIGFLFYTITFYGLKYTTSINASIFGLSEVFFSYLFFGLLFADKKSSWNELLGTGLMLLGGLIVLFPGKFEVNYGDVFIIIATLFSTTGNQFAKKTLKYFSSNFLMLVRSVISTIFLFGLYFILNGATLISMDSTIWFYLIFTGFILFGFSKYLWVEALHSITVPRASSFLVLYPIFTIIYSSIFFQVYPNPQQLVGLLPIVAGVLVLFNPKLVKRIFRV